MIGQRIGQFRVVKLLGDGGMGQVFLVEHTIMGSRHALKLLRDPFSTNPTFVKRFLNEARAAAEIGHRNVVEITQIDQVENGGPWYLVMKYHEGQTLSAFLASRAGPIPQRLIVHILGEALNGLQAAHDRKIVHRDLKPDNLYLTTTRDDPYRAIVFDFGVAQLGGENGMTQTGALLGTPQYMAPEQLRGAAVDLRADIWAMAAIAYEMATGRMPYQDPGPRVLLPATEIYHRMMSQPIVDPREINPQLSADFAQAILRGLAIDPAQRPASARQLALKLAEATRGDAYEPSGIEIIKHHADELLRVDAMLETVRQPSAIVGSTSARYEIGERLGMGGMAEVFRATVRGAEGFARTVAVKRVLRGFSDEPQFAKMFIGEAQIAMRLVHENIVSVLDFNRDEDGRLFLVMDYVEGRDLASIIASGALPPAVAVFVAVKMLRGLGYAHELVATASGARGVIHRDVSPHNVLVSWLGAVKVSDFGIAKARDAGGAAVSQVVKGKPAYMSPEQANGEPLDPRSDLFAVGIVLWEMLAGRRLFDAAGTREIFAQIMFRDAPPLTAVGVGSSAQLTMAVQRLLAREPKDRHASAAEAITALTSCPEFPRDGENELIRLLAQRFPAAAAASSAPGQRSPSSSGSTYAMPQMSAASAMSAMSGSLGDRSAPVVEISAIAPPPGAGAGTGLADRSWSFPAKPISTLAGAASEVSRVSVVGTGVGTGMGTSVEVRRKRSMWALGLLAAVVSAGGVVIVMAAMRPSTSGSASAASGHSTIAIAVGSSSVDAAPSVVAAPVTLDAGAPAAVVVVPADAASIAAAPSAPTPTRTPTQHGSASSHGHHTSPVARGSATGPVTTPTLVAVTAATPTPTPSAPTATSTPTATPAEPPAPTPAPKVGELNITIVPQAEVFVDGRSIGPTPVRTEIAVGVHKLRIKNDTRERNMTVTIAVDHPTDINEIW